MEEVTLSIQADTLSEEALHDLTRELCRTLNRETDVRATLAEAPAAPGMKGDAQLLNSIVMVLPHAEAFFREVLPHAVGHVVGGAVLAALVPFFERIRDLKLIFRDKNGKEHVLDSKSVRQDRRKQSAKAGKKKLGG